MSVHAWLRQQVSLYAAGDRVFADVDSALARFHALQPKSDVYTFDDGRAQLLLCLHGLLPISYRGASYNIPLAVWVVREYPRQPPLVYVVPTSDMLVRPGRYLDVSGRCSHDYLQNWQRKDEGCNLSGLLEDLQDQFSKEPPVYAKPQPRPQQQQQERPPPPVPARPGATSASSQPQVQVSPPNQSSSSSPLSPPKPPPKPPTEFHHGAHAIGTAVGTPITHPQAPGPPPPHLPVGPHDIPGGPPQIPPRPPSLSPLGSRSPVPGPAPTPAHASSVQGPISAGHNTMISNAPTHFGAQSPPPPPVPPIPYTQPQYTTSQSQSSQGSPYVHPRPQTQQIQGFGQVPQALSTTPQGLGAQPRLNTSQPQPLPSVIARHPQPHSLAEYSPPPPPVPPPPPALLGATGGSSLPFGAQGHFGSGQGSVYPPPQPQSQLQPAITPTRTPVPNLLDDDDTDNSSSSAQLAGIQGLPRSSVGGVVSPGVGYSPGNASNHVISEPPPRPPNPELLLLHERVHAKLTSELQSLSKAFELDAERLRATQRDLLHGEPAIKDESARLEAVRNVCLGVAERTRGAVEKLEGNIGELKRKGDPSVDEMVCAMSIVENQLLNLVAEDNAIEDTIYHLHRALNSGRIDLERFLRTTRVLAEEQFMKRALINKIQAGLAMTGH